LLWSQEGANKRAMKNFLLFSGYLANTCTLPKLKISGWNLHWKGRGVVYWLQEVLFDEHHIQVDSIEW